VDQPEERLDGPARWFRVAVNQGYRLHGLRVGQPQDARFLASGRRGQRCAQRDDGDAEPA
jgi:hypothetical protein